MNLLISYFFSKVEEESRSLNDYFQNDCSNNFRLTLAALLAIVSAILQSAGGLLPVIGLLLSPFAVFPIVICGLISLRYGVLSYIVVISLLFIIQPSELIIFPFTTGLLGVGLGFSLLYLKRRIFVLFFTSVLLLIGISFVSLVLNFPVLGPFIVKNMMNLIFLNVVVLLICWIYLFLTLLIIKKLRIILLK